MRFQGDGVAPVDPDQVAEQVEQIMSRPEFTYEPSWMERLGEWINEQLEKLFGGAEPVDGTVAPSQFGGGAGSLIAWLIIIVALIAVIAAVVFALRRRVRREDVDEDEVELEVEHRRRAAEWRSDAEEHERRGEWKLALRARYRELVRALTDTGQLPNVAGRTTGELRADLDATTPDAAADFDAASLLFELAWYADAPTDAAENRRFRELAAAVLAATARATQVDPDRVAAAAPLVEVDS